MKDKIIAVILSITLFLQGILYYFNNEKERVVLAEEKTEEFEAKSFNDFFQDINRINECKIISIKNQYEKYYASITYNGNKENFMKLIIALKDYEIESYKLALKDSIVNCNLTVKYCRNS